MSRLTRNGTAEFVSRDQVLRRESGQGNIHFPCSADHEQDWQPYAVDPYLAICVAIHVRAYVYRQFWVVRYAHVRLRIAWLKVVCRF